MCLWKTGWLSVTLALAEPRIRPTSASRIVFLPTIRILFLRRHSPLGKIVQACGCEKSSSCSERKNFGFVTERIYSRKMESRDRLVATVLGLCEYLQRGEYGS